MSYSYDRRANAFSEGVFDDTDFAELPEDERGRWKGYSYKLTTETYSPEEWEIGDTANIKTEDHGPFKTLADLFKHLATHHGQLRWQDWLDQGAGSIDSTTKKDRKGGAVQANLKIKRNDGAALSHEERDRIEAQLKI